MASSGAVFQTATKLDVFEVAAGYVASYDITTTEH